ncbi:MAG: metallophosphoesterase family protein, partial [Hyphomicrobium sp.]
SQLSMRSRLVCCVPRMPQEYHGKQCQGEVGEMAQIMILHVSDVHFGQPGSPAQHTNDTQRLIEAAHENNGLPDPDLCIFSGDLTFSGQTDQFAQGERWLKALLEPWPNCRLFVVPGNHEVARPTNDGKKEAVKKWLRSACKSKKDYEGHREYLSKGYQGLLDGFRTWHNAARSERNRLPCLMSDWSECMYGCQWSEKINDINVRVIGLNTSLLSCDNDDKGELVGDLEFLEQSLLYLKPDTTLSIVVAHHPLTGEKEHWLADWNRESIEKRLLQMTGARDENSGVAAGRSETLGGVLAQRGASVLPHRLGAARNCPASSRDARQAVV